ncbi:sigma-70 family RNA polymerase sigma factor [Gemmata sp. JC717]|uniref:sigma-70 family RNA polymerase sigma factor n=1 Tax=Gemmata algarum TaxID=2975278 RepID=UPI0021BAA5C6|nr:sigma-70 family RNA polymerase sigma factor [Gemmata algarum]MDY3556003.1 sigma-70 family RNA polymerase sigma factor [Gemmata algarum]
MSQPTARRVATKLLRTDPAATQSNDAELLARFAESRDEQAFADIVARHGGMVRGVAQRWVRDAHVAEDVCQAAFLVLARKAAAIRWAPTVGPWLHATVVRLARKALSRSKWGPVAPTAGAPSSPADLVATLAWAESCRALDEELAALPEELQGPLVLCYLQGRTRDEAAHALGCSLTKLKRRLERGRTLLRDRLTRRGITLPAVGTGLLASDVAVGTAAAETTARAAVALVSGGAVPPGAAALLGPMRGGFGAKTVALVAAGVLACGAALAALARPVGEAPPSPAPPPAEKAAAPAGGAKAGTEGPGETLPPAAVARLGSTRLRGTGAVERMAFSPDGTKLASWGGDSHTVNELVIWDTKTGRALRRVDLPGVQLNLLAWLPDGRGVALARSSYDDPVWRLWEFTDEKAAKPEVKPRKQGVGKFAYSNEPVQDLESDACFAVSPDGKTFAIGKAGQLESAREVQLWELKTGVALDALKPLKGGVIHPSNCGAVYFTPDAKGLVVFTQAKHLGGNKWESEQLVTVWDVKTSREKARFKVPRPAANGRPAVALSNTTLAIGLENGGTSLWDLTTGKERTLATDHRSKKPAGGYGTFCVAFAPDGQTLVTGGRDGVAKIWDVASGKLRHALPGYDWVDALAVAPNGKLLASSGQDGLIRLWDPATGADACPLPGHKYTVWSVALDADGTHAVTSSWDDTVRWWDVTTGTEQRSIVVKNGFRGLTLSPDGQTVLAATDNGKLRTWDRATGRETTPANLPADAKGEHLSFTPDGKHLIAAIGPKVTVLEWPALKVVRTIDLPKPGTRAEPNPPEGESQCDSVAVSPDGKWLVTVAHRHWQRERDSLRYGYAADSVADVWDLGTGKRVRRLAEGSGSFRSGMFTADGLFVLIGSGGIIVQPDGAEGESFTSEMTLFDPIAGRVVRGFEVPGVPGTVAFRYSGASALAPDGRTLYVSYNTGDIIGYEVATGRPRRTLVGHRSNIGGLAFSADGRRLISGSRDGTALVWDVTLAGAAPRTEPPSAAEADKLWQASGGNDARAALVALAELASAPEAALEVLRRHVKPAPAAPTDAALDRIFAELGSGNVADRERASKELDGYGESAVPGVRKRLDGNSSDEVRQRANTFLKEHDKPVPSAARVRQIRTVELLEGLRTPEARKLLNELAKGAAGAPLTRDAAAALKRLGQP